MATQNETPIVGVCACCGQQKVVYRRRDPTDTRQVCAPCRTMPHVCIVRPQSFGRI